MTKPTTPADIPGADLSYTDLCNSDHDSEARQMWRGLSTLADTVGVSTMRVNGFSPRSATVGDLVTDLTEALPEGTDLVAAAKATLRLFPDVPEHTFTYEVRTLKTVDGEAKWVIVGSHEEQSTAEKNRDDFADRNPDLVFIVNSIQVVTTRRTV